MIGGADRDRSARGPAQRRTTGISRLEMSEHADSGRSVRPATNTDSSMPVSAAARPGSSARCRGTWRRPARGPVTFAVSTARRRTRRSSTSGRSTRSSLRVHSASSTTATRSRPSVAGAHPAPVRRPSRARAAARARRRRSAPRRRTSSEPRVGGRCAAAARTSAASEGDRARDRAEPERRRGVEVLGDEARDRVAEARRPTAPITDSIAIVVAGALGGQVVARARPSSAASARGRGPASRGRRPAAAARSASAASAPPSVTRPGRPAAPCGGAGRRRGGRRAARPRRRPAASRSATTGSRSGSRPGRRRCVGISGAPSELMTETTRPMPSRLGTKPRTRTASKLVSGREHAQPYPRLRPRGLRLPGGHGRHHPAHAAVPDLRAALRLQRGHRDRDLRHLRRRRDHGAGVVRQPVGPDRPQAGAAARPAGRRPQRRVLPGGRGAGARCCWAGSCRA